MTEQVGPNPFSQDNQNRLSLRVGSIIDAFFDSGEESDIDNPIRNIAVDLASIQDVHAVVLRFGIIEEESDPVLWIHCIQSANTLSSELERGRISRRQVRNRITELKSTLKKEQVPLNVNLNFTFCRENNVDGTIEALSSNQGILRPFQYAHEEIVGFRAIKGIS